MKAVFVAYEPALIERHYFTETLLSRIERYAEVVPTIIQETEWKNHTDLLAEADVIFSTWGMSKLTEEEIETYMPKLKAIFYAAGSVQSFARPYMKKGIIVTSSWAANAVPVAEHTLALLLLASKGYFQAQRIYKETGDKTEAASYTRSLPGFYGLNIGLLGAGMIGRKVIELLKPFHCNVIVYDPFLTPEGAQELGVEKADSIEEVFERCIIVSNHIANLPTTQKIITKSAFDKMADNGVFINTGRGQQVVEADLIAALKEYPNRTALLDVTDPEPVESDSPFLTMNNVFLTPHIAGSLEDEIGRMMEYAVSEFEHFVKGEPLRYAVTEKMLETMA